uniref:Uncharacterized protein n=1 Tax=Neobodo designis TaxID=312471 RepID=A0A7S1MSG7_NEODS|mmetsp:Transcript_46115/g.142050  ORF Transcript_46115/g.142050 Transcript_46115/m.142050 type:complete len:1183 (+) Transcript_46115:405-3953(+)
MPAASQAAVEALRNRVVLERACVQFSGPISHAAPHDGFREAERFLEAFAKEYPHACARALVYRVECSDEGDDRLAAWLLLDHAIRLGVKEQRHLREEERRRRHEPEYAATSTNGLQALIAGVKYNVLLDAIGELLPKLIRHRWDEAVGSAADDAAKYRQPSYEAIRVGWSRAFVNPLLADVRQACEDIRRPNAGGPTESREITPPWFLVDACWKLRRERPRPAAAVYVRRLFFEASPRPEWAEAELHAICESKGAPTSANALRSAHYHSRVMEWVAFYEANKDSCCERCDVWTHSAAACKAAPEHLSHVPTPTIADARRHLARFLRDDADVNAPVFASRILDEACSMLQNERSCELLLASFDALRGSVTSASARAALELLASYRVMPSWLIDFESAPRDVVCDLPTALLRETPSMMRLAVELEQKQRRLREGLNVRAAVRVIALEFAALISRELLHDLQRVRGNGEFIFASVGLESYPGHAAMLKGGGAAAGGKKGPKRRARDAEEIAAEKEEAERHAALVAQQLMHKPDRLRKMLPEHDDLYKHRAEIDALCRHCLGARHSSKRCPKAYELGFYDLNTAKSVIGVALDKGWVESEAVQSRLNTRSNAPEDTRFRFAVYVLAGSDLKGRVPFCPFCDRENKMALGHERGDCKFANERVIEKALQTGTPMLRLLPHLADDTINRERDALKRRQADLAAAEKRGVDPDSLDGRKRAVRLKERDINDLVDAMKWLRNLEPRVSPVIHRQLKVIDGAIAELSKIISADARDAIPHVSLLPAIGLLKPEAIQEVLDATGHADISASRVFNDPSFPAEEAWSLAILRHVYQADDAGAPAADVATQLVEDIKEACITELRRDVPLADLAGERTQLARHAWDRTTATYDGIPGAVALESVLARLRGVVDGVRLRADKLRQIAVSARKATADAARRHDWSDLSQPLAHARVAETGSNAGLRPPSHDGRSDSLFEIPPDGRFPPPRGPGSARELGSDATGSRVPPPPVGPASSRGGPASSRGGAGTSVVSGTVMSSVPPPIPGASSHGGSSVPMPPVRPPASVTGTSDGGSSVPHASSQAPPNFPPPKYHRSEGRSSYALSMHGSSAPGASSVHGAASSYTSDVPPPLPVVAAPPPVPESMPPPSAQPTAHLVPPPIAAAAAVPPPVPAAPSNGDLASAILQGAEAPRGGEQ